VRVYTCALAFYGGFLRRGVASGFPVAAGFWTQGFMELFLQFVVAKWYLFAGWLLVLSLLFVHERRKGGVAVTPAQLTALVNQKEAVVVDVREAGEFRQGHIVGSINLPHTKVVERVAELERYRDRPVIVVCKMGQHSGGVSKALKEKGFEQVYRLSGGMMEWQNSQLPLVRS